MQYVGRLLIAAGALRTAGTPGRYHRSHRARPSLLPITSSGVTSKADSLAQYKGAVSGIGVSSALHPAVLLALADGTGFR
jgi:hypothetical protein